MCLVLLVSEMLLLAVLISTVTGALYGASLDGGLLYPLRKLLMGYGKAPQLRQDWVSKEQQLQQLIYGVNPAARNQYEHECTAERDKAKDRYALYAMWRKPLLLCLVCMPSVYGVLLVPIAIYCGVHIVSIPFAILASSLLNKALMLTLFKGSN